MLNNLYFGRNPAAAEIANGITIRWALAFEAARTGQEIKAADVKRAYADFGAKVLHKEADKIATQANALYRDMQSSFDAYKDGSDKAAGKIAELYRSDFDQAQQEAYRLGAEAGTNAARQLARESLAIAREHKKEAEAITGYSLRSLEFGLGCDIEKTILVTYPDTLTKEEAERRTRIRMKAREEAMKNLEEVERHPNADDPLIASDAERQTVEAAVQDLYDRRRKLRELWQKLTGERQMQFESRRKFREPGADGEHEARKERQDDNRLNRLIEQQAKGVLFDLDNPLDIREMVNMIALLVANARIGHDIRTKTELSQTFRDPIVIRDIARTLAQAANAIAARLTYGRPRELIMRRANRLAHAETVRQAKLLAVSTLAAIRDMRVRETQQDIRTQIIRAVDSVAKRGKLTVGMEDTDRKITGELELRLREIRRILRLGETAQIRLRDEATALLTGVTSRPNAEAEADTDRDAIAAMRTLSAINLVAH